MDTASGWWAALESIPGQTAVDAVWRGWLGNNFESLRHAFLRSQPETPARSVPCPRACGCWHEVIRHGPTDLMGVCQCESWNCDDLTLSPADITPWRLDWPKLGRALSRAFGLDTRIADLGLGNALQIGSWSAAAMPVVLAVPTTEPRLLLLVNTLLSRWRQPFILFTPTARHLGLTARELLAGAGAGWFTLESTVVFTPAGTLVSGSTPGELFARFNPRPNDPPEENAARQAFVLVQQLEGDRPSRPPSALTVFRLYCMDELSIQQVARKCGCSKPTVLSRLRQIRLKTGLAPAALRRYSAHFDKMEEDFADPRARQIHRRNLLDAGENSEEPA